MATSYNFDRPLNQRQDRLNELEKKAVKRDEGSYMVVIGSDAYYGDETSSSFFDSKYYFKNIQTAKSFAQHYTDVYDCRAGLFKCPQFICGISEC